MKLETTSSMAIAAPDAGNGFLTMIAQDIHVTARHANLGKESREAKVSVAGQSYAASAKTNAAGTPSRQQTRRVGPNSPRSTFVV